VGFIPQDRRSEGLVLSLSLTENVALALHDVPEWRRGPFLRWRAIREETRGLLRRHGVRAPGPGTPAEALSGGNQQKVVVGRELDREPDLLIVENPTRGLDVGAALRVHELLREARPGRAMVLISTDLDEVLALSDRILVMVRGRLLPVPDDQRTRAGVGARMLTGATAGVAG
jgi:general nucleoside transport system ATP-binding protein